MNRDQIHDMDWAHPLRCERGSTIVEFALTASLYFVLVFGVIEGGRAILYYNVLAHSAREGTRFASVRGQNSGRATNAAAVATYVQTKAVGLNPTVNASWNPSTMAPGSQVTVQVQRTFTPIVPIAGIGTLNMSATAVGTVLQ